MKRSPRASRPEEAAVQPTERAIERQEAFDFGPERPAVREARPGERPGVLEVIGRAFHDDPVSMYLFPNDASRIRDFGRFSGLAIDAFGAAGLVMTTDNVRGAAIWRKPESAPAGFFGQLSLGFQMLRIAGWRFRQAGRLGDLMQQLHPPEPHYYLAALGTDPDHQRQGIGSALMQPVLSRCDKERATAYLESSKRENIPFYNKHGFEVMDEVAVPEGPTLWPMIRRVG